ncbi:MAG: tRNA (adenosine(37)-N6)-threonylcarbamoyltransferase complex ATPase subunit type 1 TsaE [Bacteroidales bacterium]|nr:tRNA (adenosine(37)-N6)-threonylcarbamoyltransferase complex ATPase subunit type 1 TsaE [Bacteroidales bacterium]
MFTIEYKLENISKVVNQVFEFFYKNSEVKVVAFYGEMGSGKTTLIKEICSKLGVKDVVTSPTFAIINEYNANKGDYAYHFDFYRLKNINEAIDIAAEDYFYSNNYCFIEWPEIVEPLLPEKFIVIRIIEINQNTRKITISI